MDYITSEQFLQQPEKVQKALISWWHPEMYDLFFRDFGNNQKNYLNGIYKGCIQDKETLNNASKDKSFKPLFTEGQLRKFIQDKTGYKMIAVPFINDADIPCIDIRLKDMNIGKLLTKSICIETYDLLQAYWQVACKIAGES